MKRLVIAASVLALGLAASSAARAGYAVVMFKKDGYCRSGRRQSRAGGSGLEISLGRPEELGLRDEQEALRDAPGLVSRFSLAFGPEGSV
jgi:hypothetical protein